MQGKQQPKSNQTGVDVPAPAPNATSAYLQRNYSPSYHALPHPLVKALRCLVDKAKAFSDEAWRWRLASGYGYGSNYSGYKSQMINVTCVGRNITSDIKYYEHQGYSCDSFDNFHPASAITKRDEEA